MSAIVPSVSDFLGIDHVQLPIHPGGEERARAFFGGLLGLREIPKPPALAVRGGLWFECGAHQIHLGVEADYKPSKKAHPALRLRDKATLDRIQQTIEAAGIATKRDDESVPGVARFFVDDPFGNRIEVVASSG